MTRESSCFQLVRPQNYGPYPVRMMSLIRLASGHMQGLPLYLIYIIWQAY